MSSVSSMIELLLSEIIDTALCPEISVVEAATISPLKYESATQLSPLETFLISESISLQVC